MKVFKPLIITLFAVAAILFVMGLIIGCDIETECEKYGHTWRYKYNTVYECIVCGNFGYADGKGNIVD